MLSDHLDDSYITLLADSVLSPMQNREKLGRMQFLEIRN